MEFVGIGVGLAVADDVRNRASKASVLAAFTTCASRSEAASRPRRVVGCGGFIAAADATSFTMSTALERVEGSAGAAEASGEDPRGDSDTGIDAHTVEEENAGAVR